MVNPARSSENWELVEAGLGIPKQAVLKYQQTACMLGTDWHDTLMDNKRKPAE